MKPCMWRSQLQKVVVMGDVFKKHLPCQADRQKGVVPHSYVPGLAFLHVLIDCCCLPTSWYRQWLRQVCQKINTCPGLGFTWWQHQTIWDTKICPETSPCISLLWQLVPVFGTCYQRNLSAPKKVRSQHGCSDVLN